MALSDELRRELAAVEPARTCCRRAELSGLLHGAGTVVLHGRGEVGVRLDVAEHAVARRAFSLLRDLGIPAAIRSYRRRAFDRSTRFELDVAGTAGDLDRLREAGVLDMRRRPLTSPPRRVVGRACCRGAYLRGALLAAGSLSGPRSAHLEIRAATVEGARFVAGVAGHEGVELRVVDRGRHAAAYAKSFDAIEAVLALAGAGGTVLALEERAVVRATRGRANRLANADHANLVRSARAAHRQARAVRALQASGELDRLPVPLRQAAALRARHPTLSLRELAERADPAVPRPTLARRLARLVALAGLDAGGGERRAGGEAPRKTSPSG